MEYPGSWYQPLFDLMYNEHNRIMLQTEMDDIIEVVHKMLNSDNELKKLCDIYDVPPEILKPATTFNNKKQ